MFGRSIPRRTPSSSTRSRLESDGEGWWGRSMIIMLSATDTDHAERCWERTTEEETTGRKILQPIIRFILKFNVKSENPTLPEIFQKHFSIEVRPNSLAISWKAPKISKFQHFSWYVDDGCWRWKVLVTASRFWWRL